jgi:hypothetical protein
MIPSYKSDYISSVGVLYRPLQDVEIYVEDHDSEVFYTQLFGRLLGTDIRIKKIIPMGGRTCVLTGVENHDNSFPKVFVIDGDLYWVSQTFDSSEQRLFQYNFYCVENALFCKNAALTIVQETLGNINLTELQELFNWEEWLDSFENELIELFVIFATAFKLKPSIKTTSRGVHSIIRNVRRSVPVIDHEKLQSVKDEVQQELNHDFGEDAVKSEMISINNWVETNNFGINIVSGKDFLLPLLSFKIKEVCGLDMKTESRNFRLAKYCDLSSLEPLKTHILDYVGSYTSPSH